jgi:serine/threonine-protein kinase
MPSPDQLPDKYQLFGEIARGGMGAVLRGRDADLGRDLAVKVLLEAHKDKPELVRRFVEEAQIGGQLQHPGVVPVYELGAFADRRPFFTMKLVKGRTLADWLRARPSPAGDLPRFLSIFESVCQTIAYAHVRGVIHRDLKPSNIMVGAFGEVQVMDWGLAKVLPRGVAVDDRPLPPSDPEAAISVIRTARSGSEADASASGSVLGTPGYMAPEQARGEIEAVDERADVFGLGAILCEILTGAPAFSGRHAGEAQRKAARGDLSEAFALLDRCGADPELIVLARDCLATEREDRPRRAGEVSERITAYLAGVQERLRTAEVARVEERARRRLTRAVAASVLALVVLGGGGWAYLARREAARREATEQAVSRELDEANRLWGQARAAPVGELSPWSEARAAARRADALLAGGAAGAAVRARAQGVLAGLEQEQAEAQAKSAEARRDRQLLDRLERIRSKMSEPGGADRLDAEYAAAFREFGLDLDTLDPKEAGRQLARRSAPVELASFLDEWAWSRAPRPGWPGDPSWQRLIAVARAADPDPWRDALRAQIGRHHLEDLRRLADDETALEGQPAPSLVLLARALETVGALNPADRVLRRAWRLHPDDFWVNFELGSLGIGRPLFASRRADEAVRFLSAARACRSRSIGARLLLAIALLFRGDFAEAAAECREVIRLKPDDPESHFTLGTILAGHEDWPGAIAEYRETIRLRPDFRMAHYAMGFALLGQGKPGEALAEFGAAIRPKPKPGPAPARSNPADQPRRPRQGPHP